MEGALADWFSHPAVQGVTLWGFWDGNIWWAARCWVRLC